MQQKSTILTGIKPTGLPHIGNYFGAIQPGVSRAAEYDQSFFFIADYHALNSVQDAKKLKELTHTVAATWLACGLNPETTHFYRQSDIPEIFELETILNSFTPKGWMNKAHAYKAAVATNQAAKKPDDHDVSMGLYTYPILMASDILTFRTNDVPVGKDQIQHVEIARDIALRFNSYFGTETFTLPNYVVHEGIIELPGLDGRKMSKSYGNVLPLFADDETLLKAVRSIVTDSTTHTEETLKDTTFYKIFASVANDSQRQQLIDGIVSGSMGWKDAKDMLFTVTKENFAAETARFNELMAHPEEIDAILKAGAEKVRPLAQAMLTDVKRTIGVL